MYKRQLRISYKQKRLSLDTSFVSESSIQIANHLLQMPLWHALYYHLFFSIVKNKEVDTQPILSILLGKDKNIVVPKVKKNGILNNYLFTDATTLKTNDLGIPEPDGGLLVPEDMLDVVFVPLLAFDNKGNRVGYGGGYYDRLLQKCKKETLKIGISFFEAEQYTIQDIASTDVTLDYCVTPNTIYSF
mgnify:CR=1 FL=1